MDDSFKIQQLSKKYVDQSLTLLAKTYLKREPVCKAIDFENHPEAIEEMLQTFLAVAEEGVSVIAIDRRTDEVAAVLLNQISVRYDREKDTLLETRMENFQHEQSRQYVRYCVEVRNFFKPYWDPKLNVAIQGAFGCTSSEFEGIGLMGRLIDFTINLGQQLHQGLNVKLSINDVELDLKPVPEMAVALCTSAQTRNILIEKFGFELIKEIDLNTLEFEGNRLLDFASGESVTESLVVKKFI